MSGSMSIVTWASSHQSTVSTHAIVQQMYVHRPPLVNSFLISQFACFSANELRMIIDEPVWQGNDGGRWRRLLGRLDVRDALDQSYSHFSNPVIPL